jgi:citrate synthase
VTATHIATSTPADITVRGKSLTRELIGKLTLTEMLCLSILGEVPAAPRIACVDACLVALMEHGLTPSALATRLVYGSAPEAMQGAVAAGLLGVGGQFVGTVEGCARLLERIVGGEAPADIVATVAPLPGFGHPLHAPDDPRTPALFAVARAHGIAGRYIAALEALSAALDAAKHKHVTINATGSVAAVLADAGIPIAIMRGFALVARCAGLIGHVAEEQREPAMRSIWEAAERAVPYQEEKAK